MVAIINSGKSIRKSFYYNDNKLEKGAAELLMAENYPMEMKWMNQDQRRNVLLKSAKKNAEMKRPSLHISLNFAPGEQLSNALLKQITADYMQAIGLGGQPYLMYRHYDSGHPHVHIVTHRVGPDGSPLDTYRIGELKSNPARKMLEEKYGLVKAEDHRRGLYNLPPVNITKAIYSQSETKKGIEDRLNYVLHKYKFSSLNAMNAVLKGYNVCADRGSRDSRIFKNNGLVFRLIGPSGTFVGVPIPASDLYVPATLKLLQTVFKNKREFTPEEKARVKNAVDLTLKKHPRPSFSELSQLLLKENIRIVPLKNPAGQIYGISYVDSKNKCAFDGNDLGTAYCSNAIQQRCKTEMPVQEATPGSPQKSAIKDVVYPNLNTRDRCSEDFKTSNSAPAGDEEKGFFEILMAPENTYEQLPYELRRRKKKKKKK